MSEEQKTITVNANVARLIAANPSTPFSATALAQAARDEVVAVEGCVERLMYLNDGDDIHFVRVGGTTVTRSQAKNLNDFRDRLQEAANHGHGVAFCWFKDEKRINMLHVIPCECNCSCRKD